MSLEEILLSVIKIFLLGREASLQIATLWLIFPFLVKMTLRGDSIQIDEFLGEGDEQSKEVHLHMNVGMVTPKHLPKSYTRFSHQKKILET